MTRYFVIFILISIAFCAETQIKLNVNSQTQSRLDQALKNLVDQLQKFATPKQSALYLQLKVDQTAKCLSIMRDQLNQYNNVIVGEGNQVNGDQNIIVGNYNSISGSDNFVFINNFKGQINGSLLLGRWKIELSKKQFIRINPSWVIFFLSEEDNKKYEKYLKKNNQWGSGSGMSKATISVFKQIKEEMKNELQKGFMNLSKPATILNGQVYLSSSGSTTIMPSLGENKMPFTLVLPTTKSTSNNTMNQQFTSLTSTIQQQSNLQSNPFINANAFPFPINDIKTGFIPISMQIPPTQNVLLNNQFSNLNIGFGFPVNSNNNNFNTGIDFSLSASKDNVKPTSSVIIGSSSNLMNQTSLQTKNTSFQKSLQNSLNNTSKTSQKTNNNLRVEDKPPSNSYNPINAQLRNQLGPKYLRPNQNSVLTQIPALTNLPTSSSLGINTGFNLFSNTFPKNSFFN